jgi:hypothetical protein
MLARLLDMHLPAGPGEALAEGRSRMNTTKRSDRRGIAPLLALGIAGIIGATAIGLRGCTPTGDITLVINSVNANGPRTVDVNGAGPTAPTTSTSVPPSEPTTASGPGAPEIAASPASEPPPEETPKNVPEEGTLAAVEDRR